jgi:hypothetical protein
VSERKRARDLKVGDVLPDGATVQRIAPGSRGLNIIVRAADGTKRRMKYAPDTVMPEPGEHPSSFADGHPWDRKRRAHLREQQL